MPQISLPAEGGCRCGKVRIRITAAPLLAMACHCRGCQRMTASAFSTSLAVPTDGFAVTEGDTVIGGLHGDEAHHHHCDWCKSWVFTELDPSMGFVNVRASLLDDASGYAPFVETCTAEGFAWAKTGATHSYAQFPPMADYERLTTEYAATI